MITSYYRLILGMECGSFHENSVQPEDVCLYCQVKSRNECMKIHSTNVQVLRRKIEIDIKSKEQNWQGSDHSHISVHVFKIN